jgi:hypothetical protein
VNLIRLVATEQRGSKRPVQQLIRAGESALSIRQLEQSRVLRFIRRVSQMCTAATEERELDGLVRGDSEKSPQESRAELDLSTVTWTNEPKAARVSHRQTLGC